MMGTKDVEAPEEDANDKKMSSFQLSSVCCSICLDLVIKNGDRSRAKLQCGHEFHLDCIGSAFNMKGAMQCPNCRNVERGRWLYANGSGCSFSEFNMNDWTHDEEPYEFNYSEMPFRVHWCPFSGLTQTNSSFEEAESPTTTYNGLHAQHAIYAHHAAGSPLAHSYIAHFQPPQPAYSNSNENTDDFNSSHHWDNLTSEIYASHAYPAIDIQYQRWLRPSPFSAIGRHANGADQTPVPPATFRSNGESDATARSGTFIRPFPYGHNNARPHERILVSHAIHHQLQPNQATGMSSSIIPGFRRFSGLRGLPHSMPAISQYDHGGGFYIYLPSAPSGRNVREGESPLLRHFNAWDADRFSYIPFHHASSANSSSRSGHFWPRQGS